MTASEKQGVVAFTLVRYARPEPLRVFAHLGLDRWSLARATGLRFWRLLGVGRGRVFDPHPDLQRFALLTVWDSPEALERFERQAAMMRRIQQHAEEVWSVQMQPVTWHGRWGGRDPFAGLPVVVAPEPGPWIILTRATVRPLHWRAFLAAVPAVSTQLLAQPELLTSVGIGEAPLFYQATLSLWRTLPAVTAFAYGPQAHREVIRRTRQQGWYREELFARFRPIASMGTWDGVDPLSL